MALPLPQQDPFLGVAGRKNTLKTARSLFSECSAASYSGFFLRAWSVEELETFKDSSSC